MQLADFGTPPTQLIADGILLSNALPTVPIVAGESAAAQRWRGAPARHHEVIGALVSHEVAISRTGSALSIALRRGSRKVGSSKFRPRASIGSSTANPGISVAISNRTPPGSRK